ncbi:DUF4258 domain-containing protein [Deltaproteobacteria bacterium]|nr:DUF4258 domain-containing protein [Deltaproteobacteria bacterium]
MTPEGKTASPKATWALLAEGVSSARLEAHRLHHLMTRVMKMVDKSPAKDSIYQMAGDIIQVAPRRMETLERHLDRLSYILSVMGTDHLRDLLPISDRAMVDDAVEGAGPFGASMSKSSRLAERYMAQRVARQYMADLMPPLGYPGGPCHVTKRIWEEVRNPKLRDELIDDVEMGLKLENRDASKVYDLEVERGDGGFKKLEIVPHAQYRMDQRGITVPEVRLALRSFGAAFKRGMELQKQNVKKPKLVELKFLAKRWGEDMARRQPIQWTDPAHKLTIVVVVMSKDTVRLITAYWKGQSDPKGPGEGTCPVPSS